MFYYLIAILGILITVFFVIGIHEAAHFYMARLFKVKVLRFSIGFGKKLFQWHDKKGTEYVVALVPLGGYVKMLDEGEGPVAEAELPYSYNRQPFIKKFLIVLAGPLSNLLSALVIYWVIFMVGFMSLKPVIGNVTPNSIAAAAGVTNNSEIVAIDNHPTKSWMRIMMRLLSHLGNQDEVKFSIKPLGGTQTTTHILDLANWKMDELSPDPLLSLGISPYQPDLPLIIGVIAKDAPAETAGLKIGDRVVAVGKLPIQNWQHLITLIAASPNETLTFTVQRADKKFDLPVTIGAKTSITQHVTGFLGIGPKFEWPKNMLQKVQYGPLSALQHAWEEIYDFTYFNLLLFGKMIVGKVSLQSLGGPITIFESAGDALNSGFLSFLAFIAFLSISIGVINLLPIPGLDGGHLLIQTIEAIRGKPLSIPVLNLVYRLGFILLFLVLIQAFVNDILRI